ncbi:MAG: hypothetical protein AABX51_03940 [Nanoarchaeota archaeon]
MDGPIYDLSDFVSDSEQVKLVEVMSQFAAFDPSDLCRKIAICGLQKMAGGTLKGIWAADNQVYLALERDGQIANFYATDYIDQIAGQKAQFHPYNT